MFNHLLVPLDGTSRSEAALDAAVRLAGRSAAGVTLLHLVERRPPGRAHGERHLSTAEEAEAYLQAVAARFPREVPVRWHVHATAVKRVDRGIAEHIRELSPDTIVMAQHGRCGWRGWLFGRVAQQVVAEGQLPVLLVRPGFAGRTMLVPHDDVEGHNNALDAAVTLARLLESRVHFLRVVPTRAALRGTVQVAGGLLPAAADTLLDMEQDAAAADLRVHLEQAAAAGVRAEARVARGDPVRVIRAYGAKIEADILVLGTHGKAGAAAFWEGSVAARLCGRTDASVLLVPAAEERQKAKGRMQK